ncbi:phenylalanine--tRNA ligase subunit beta [Candidatus Uhrbacteria bacterium]|nr:phenylalanine--tRNA ligase subunit beta [Candidatus Uhrbacteria bacterium]
MNILISYNWIKEYLDTDFSPEKFAKETTAVGNSVERIDRLSERFEKMVVGFVKKVKPHPNADKLKIAETDIGKETVEIICGGVNLSEGQRVVVGLPGAKVKWHGEGDLVELAKTKIRGVESFGMICAVEEIGFEKLPHGYHEIWDITELTSAKPGTSIAKALELDDTIFDIEVTSNRVDCMSIIGQAREGAVVTGKGLKGLKSLKGGKEVAHGFSRGWIEVKEPEFCPKYSAILIENVKVGPSPWWLQKRLLLAGHRPINNVVDITNYVLHEYGQPLHAFDADKLDGEKIIVRKAKKGEKMKALDGKTYEFSHDMLVIADVKKPIAVAGVMGGEETATTENTTRVLIESATFDPVSVRRTARALNLYSDSQLLFEKGLSTESIEPAIARAVELITELTGGRVASLIITEQAKSYEPRVFPFDTQKARKLMGIEMEDKKMIEILERLGFVVNQNDSTTPRLHDSMTFSVTVPYWRDHDIEAPVDFVEEIARVHGYENFPSIFPSGEIQLIQEDQAIKFQRRTREILKGAGFTEVYSYSFFSEKQLTEYGIKKEDAIVLRNPLSSEFEFMRPSLVPSMLTTVEQNQHRFPEADLFEIAPVYIPKKGDLPDEPLNLVMACYGKDGRELFLRSKGALARLMRELGINDWSLERSRDPADYIAHYHDGRLAGISIGKNYVGEIGQVSDMFVKNFGLDSACVLIDIREQDFFSKYTSVKSFKPIPQFPEVKRDLAFVLDEKIEYKMIEEKLGKISTLLEQIELFDVYRGKGVDEGKKSLAIHLSFRSNERTLESKEVDNEVEKIRRVLKEEFNAILRS